MFLAPWLALPAASRGLSDIPLPVEIPTLREQVQQTLELLPVVAHRLDESRREAEKLRLLESRREAEKLRLLESRREAEKLRLPENVTPKERDWLAQLRQHIAAMAFARLGDSAKAWELLGMINPVNHRKTPQAIAAYKVEPYVIAADVYAVAPHTGRGGWSWYTGSAGWMYRLILESLLGLRREGDTLRFEPCLPGDWQGVSLRYRYGETFYPIVVSQTFGDGDWQQVTLDGIELPDGVVRLIDDRHEHRVDVQIRRGKTDGADGWHARQTGTGQ